MYAVVGCSDCGALWIVDGRPETSTCPRCGTTRDYAKRRKFVSTDDRDHARQVRAELLASRQGLDEEFADLETVAEMAAAVEDAGVDDETYLEGSGLDAEEIAAAGERANRSGGGASRQTVLRDALRDLESPTEAAVVDYVEERGVPGEYATRALEKLVRAGEVTTDGETYRLL